MMLNKNNISLQEFLNNAMKNRAEVRPLEYAFVYQCLCKLDINTTLDVGCRESNLANFLAKVGYESYGIDINPYPKPSFNFILADIFNYDFKMKFDLVIAISTIEHIGLSFYGQKNIDKDGDKRAMEILRNCTNRYFILTVPFGKYIFDKNFARSYNHQTLNSIIEGFNPCIEEYYTKIKGKLTKVDKKDSENVCSVAALLLEKKN